MKIDRNVKDGLPRIVFEQSDVSDLARIEEMFNGIFKCHKCGSDYENHGWETYKKYLESERIKLQAMMKLSVSLNRMSEETTKVEVAKLVGFDHFLEMEDRIKIKLEKLREVTKENTNGTNANEYGD